MAYIFAIDFGTANYRMSVFQGKDPVMIPDRDGNVVFPSVVACTRGNQWLVGSQALLQSDQNLDNTFFSIKKLLGSEELISVNGTELKPTQIVAQVFEKIKADAALFFGYVISEVVISYPAAFTRKQVMGLLKAAELAFLNVRRIIKDTDAVAVYYNRLPRKDEDEKVLVLDVGAGFTGLGIYELGDGVIEARMAGFALNVSGDSVRALLFNFCLEEFRRVNGIECALDHNTYMKLYHSCELAKLLLSQVEYYRIFLPELMQDSAGKALNMDIRLSREVMELLLNKGTLQELEKLFYDGIKRAGYAFSDIDVFIFTGLAARTPAIRSLLNQFAPENKQFEAGPYAAVFGAAIEAGILTRQVTDSLLLACTSRSLLILTAFLHSNLIAYDTNFPSKRAETFVVRAKKSHHFIEVHVVEQSSHDYRELETLGTLLLPCNIQLGDEVDVEVSIGLDGSGKITVSGIIKGQEKGLELQLPVDYPVPDRSKLTSLLEEKPIEE